MLTGLGNYLEAFDEPSVNPVWFDIDATLRHLVNLIDSTTPAEIAQQTQLGQRPDGITRGGTHRAQGRLHRELKFPATYENYVPTILEMAKHDHNGGTQLWLDTPESDARSIIFKVRCYLLASKLAHSA